MYQALPFVKKRNLYSGFFKKFSMSYHSFLVVSQDSVKLEHRVLLMRSVWLFDCFLTKVQPFLYSAMCLPWHRVCWWSIRSYGWSCTCMCSNNASPSWERGAGRNEPEKNMAQLRCHLSPSCEKLKGHCGIVFLHGSAQLPFVAVMWNAKGSLWNCFFLRKSLWVFNWCNGEGFAGSGSHWIWCGWLFL